LTLHHLLSKILGGDVAKLGEDLKETLPNQ
jgi:hypothetical protein